MRKIREVLRLKFEAGLSERVIAQAVACSRSALQECLKRARTAGIGWPLPADLDEAALHERLYPREPLPSLRPEPDWAWVHEELARPGVTKLLLWQELKAKTPEGLGYSQFCERYRRWLKSRDLVLRQEHKPGEKMFVDYAGQTVGVTDRLSGEKREAQIFVAVLGASNYTFAEATWTQSLPDWLSSHVRALEFFGGVPQAAVIDNLKSGVARAHRYDPDLNPAYQDLAEHYGLAVLPARVRRPRDKAKVEAGVLVVERWILARLRNTTFFSLAELNETIAALLKELNTRPFKKQAGSRASLYEEKERACLKPLPERPYEFGNWKKAKVRLDYHVEVARRYYSVPHAFATKTVDVRVTARGIEVFFGQKLIASHIAAPQVGAFVTHPGHRPERHRAVVEASHERLIEQAAMIGPATREVVAAQTHMKRHPEEVLRSAKGIIRLAKDYSPEALERACVRALALKSFSYRALKLLIAMPEPQKPAEGPSSFAHENLRGESYFKSSIEPSTEERRPC
jgi:transposase